MARLLSRHGWNLGIAEGRYDEGIATLRSALERARTSKDSGLEADVLGHLAAVSGQHVHWKECLAYAQQAAALVAYLPSADATTSGGWGCQACEALGDLPEGARLAGVAFNAALLRRRLLGQAAALAFTASFARMGGDWASAEAALEKAAGFGPNGSEVRVLMAFQRGLFAKGEEALLDSEARLRDVPDAVSFEVEPQGLSAKSRSAGCRVTPGVDDRLHPGPFRGRRDLSDVDALVSNGVGDPRGHRSSAAAGMLGLTAGSGKGTIVGIIASARRSPDRAAARASGLPG